MNDEKYRDLTLEKEDGFPFVFPESCVAVLIPCFNEQESIGRVVHDFKEVLPRAKIYVYDNNSTDCTAEIAQKAGAIVRHETMQGKGHVVCRMFGEIDADVYLLVDGDGTYDANSAPGLIRHLIADHMDMVCAMREETDVSAYRRGHRFGNRLLTGLVGRIFGNHFQDMLTGYRALSRRYVKSFPALSEGFEIETQLAVHALEMRMRVAEIPSPYFERSAGSMSKLRTFRDGWRILKTILYLLKEEKPLLFFSGIFAALTCGSLILAWPVLIEYLQTGLVPRFPTAILAAAMMQLAFLALASGLVLDTVSHGRRELKRLHYLAIPSLPANDSREREGNE